MIAYLIILLSYLVTKHLERKYTHLTFSLIFGYILCYHLYKYIYHYLEWRVDVSGVIMMMSINVHSIACNYVDGAKQDTELS